MKRISVAILFVALTLPALALAQSSAPEKDKSAFSVTRAARGKVVEVKSGERLTIEDPGGKRQEFKLDNATKIPANLKPGDQVKVTYRASDRTAVEVQRTGSKG